MKKDINYIISKILSNSASVDEILQFSQWLAESKDNHTEFNMLKSYWEAEVRLQEKATPDFSFLQLHERIKRKKNRRRFFLYSLSVACSVMVLLGVGLFTRLLTTDQEQQEFKIMADKGQRASVDLPDGSKAWLNSHTTLSYSNMYGQGERVITLDGEAYFEVAPANGLRFIVKAANMEIEALGTSFNVKAYAEDDAVTTTLFSGKVNVKAGNENAILTPNQYAAFNKKTQEFTKGSPEHPEYASMWLSNEFSSDGQTLGEIAITLNRMYNVHVEFESEKVQKHRFRGAILNKSLDNILAIISLTSPITYSSDGDTIRISEKH